MKTDDIKGVLFVNGVSSAMCDALIKIFPFTSPLNERFLMRIARAAAAFHTEQTRKYSGEPYIVHPLAVAQLVCDAVTQESVAANLTVTSGAARAAIGAALLHDVVEDTCCTFEMLDMLVDGATAHMHDKTHVCGYVLDAVAAMTDPETHADGNRKKRHQMKCDRFKRATSCDTILSAIVRTVKLADLIDNSRSIIERDSKFAKVYMHEMGDMLDALAPDRTFSVGCAFGNDLYERARAIHRDYYAFAGKI